jgi:hypothetical protein
LSLTASQSGEQASLKEGKIKNAKGKSEAETAFTEKREAVVVFVPLFPFAFLIFNFTFYEPSSTFRVWGAG